MRRLAVLIAVLAILAAGGFAWLRATRYAPARPGLPPQHLVLVTCEGLRADHASFLGYAKPTTRVPSDETQRIEGRAMGLDDLAAAGVLFANGSTPSADPVSALATLFTGLAPPVHGAQGTSPRLDPAIVTLPQRLRDAHFVCAAFVTGKEKGLEGLLGAGFETFETFTDDTGTLGAAARWMDRDVGSGARLFLWVHLAGPVPPWDGRALDEDVEASTAERDFGIPGAGAADGSRAYMDRLAHDAPAPTAEGRAQLAALYDREVARMTFGLEKFLRLSFDPYAGAEASETWPRTVFAFASIHGLELGERGAVGAADSVYDCVLRVPILLRHPDSLTGERILATPVELADLCPTFLEWFELDPPAPGARSLLALLDAHPARTFEPRASCGMSAARVFSVRTDRWHLVWNPLGAAPRGRARGAIPAASVELYEPARDPLERFDVSAEHPLVVAELQGVLRRWRETVKLPSASPASARNP